MRKNELFKCDPEDSGVRLDPALVQKTKRWVFSETLPLWAERGIDKKNGGCVEALDHCGAPLSGLPRRVRIHPRQCYVFARAGRYDPERYLPVANDLFRFTMACFDPQTKRLASLTSPEGAVLGAGHQLYDLSFVLLAASAMVAAGFGIEAELAFLERRLAELKAPRGWFETPSRAFPRLQNSHMHLFEASVELFAATGAPVWQEAADECLELFHEKFAASDGTVREFFDQDWVPVKSIQRNEPGHAAEWISLLHRYEQVMGAASGGNFRQIYQYLLRASGSGSLLPDCTAPVEQSSRLWPQTEFLKALLSLRHYGIVHQTCSPEKVVKVIFDTYLATPVPGGWYDKRSATGELLSDKMPSSSLYHLYSGFVTYLEERGALRPDDMVRSRVGAET
nr:AGE family epimerase/isomerase [Ruegeria profundi]